MSKIGPFYRFRDHVSYILIKQSLQLLIDHPHVDVTIQMLTPCDIVLMQIDRQAIPSLTEYPNVATLS